MNVRLEALYVIRGWIDIEAVPASLLFKLQKILMDKEEELSLENWPARLWQKE